MKIIYSLIALVNLVLLCQAQSRLCNGITLPRYPLHLLSPQSFQRFARAVLVLMQKNNPAQISWYDYHANIHIQFQSINHGFSPFFTWHRVYLRQFEMFLQMVDPMVTVPCWDWSRDSQAPERSIVFSPFYFGGNGGSNGCVQDGMFSRWVSAYPRPNCLNRSFDGGNVISSWYSPEAINRGIIRSRSYEDLRAFIEPLPHAAVHVNVGGSFATMASVNDPIFWCHHAFVDYIYFTWQQTSGNGGDYSGTMVDGSQANYYRPLAPFPERAVDVLDIRNLCYFYVPINGGGSSGPFLFRRSTFDYEDNHKIQQVTLERRNTTLGAASYGGGVTVPAYDRSVPDKLRTPQPIPNAWLQNNNHYIPAVRELEADCSQLYVALNSLSDYLSPCSFLGLGVQGDDASMTTASTHKTTPQGKAEVESLIGPMIFGVLSK